SIYKTEGLRGIYKGSVSSLGANIAESSVVFGINEVLKREMYGSNTKSSTSFYQDMMIGSVSGLAATIVSCPLETIKCNTQVQKNTYNKTNYPLMFNNGINQPKPKQSTNFNWYNLSF